MYSLQGLPAWLTRVDKNGESRGGPPEEAARIAQGKALQS